MNNQIELIKNNNRIISIQEYFEFEKNKNECNDKIKIFTDLLAYNIFVTSEIFRSFERLIFYEGFDKDVIVNLFNCKISIKTKYITLLPIYYSNYFKKFKYSDNFGDSDYYTIENFTCIIPVFNSKDSKKEFVKEVNENKDYGKYVEKDFNTICIDVEKNVYLFYTFAFEMGEFLCNEIEHKEIEIKDL